MLAHVPTRVLFASAAVMLVAGGGAGALVVHRRQRTENDWGRPSQAVGKMNKAMIGIVHCGAKAHPQWQRRPLPSWTHFHSTFIAQSGQAGLANQHNFILSVL
jgi:hypothetical protein